MTTKRLTAQQAFEISAKGLLKQGKRSTGEIANDGTTGLCAYRGIGGKCCGVGFLLEDDIAKGFDKRLQSGISDIEDFGLLPDNLKGLPTDFLYKLQMLHDDLEPIHWYDALSDFGDRYQLDTKFLKGL